MEMVLAAGFILLIVLIFVSGNPRSQWRGTDTRHEEANPNIVTLTAANWQKEVLDSSTPVLVDFWAPRCVPCKWLAPAIERVATRFAGKVKVGKLDVDKAQNIAADYRIEYIPMVMLFRGGVPQRIVVDPGNPAASEASIAAAIDRVPQ